jgi:hypothetical protein
MTQLVTTVDKKQLTSIFRVLTEKQDADTQIYPRNIVIGLRDIKILEKSMNEQLTPYSNLSYTDSATIEFSNNRTKDFNRISDLENSNWDRSEQTASVTLRWNLLLEHPNSEKPVEHNIVLRIASGVKPHDFMRAIFSKDIEDVDTFDIASAGCICHITFATQSLANDIFRVVDEWVSGRPTPEYTLPYLLTARKHSQTIARAIRFTLPVMAVLALLAYYCDSTHNLPQEEAVTIGFIRMTMLYGVGLWGVYISSGVVAKFLSNHIEQLLRRIGRIHPFLLTAGDDNHQNELAAKNKKSFIRFCFEGFIAIAWNLVAGYAIYRLTTNQ